MYQGQSSRRSTQVARSQLAVRLGIAMYSAVLALIALRIVVLVVDLPESVWSVRSIISLSSPIVRPLQVIPAAQRPLLGSATLSDLTAGLVLVALPLLFLGRRSWA
jgi:hypothetical protein